jgi:hypothetical protein
MCLTRAVRAELIEIGGAYKLAWGVSLQVRAELMRAEL